VVRDHRHAAAVRGAAARALGRCLQNVSL
jgi:hypothetical protein